MVGGAVMVWAVILAVIALSALGMGVGLYFFDFALNPHRRKRRVFEADHNAIRGLDEYARRREKALAWWEAVPHGEAWLQSRDGLRLRAHIAENPGGGERWAVLCHGYTGQGSNMFGMGRNYHEAGYSLLLPDFRGHGESQGDYIGMGWHDRLDLLDWVDFILKRHPQAKIVLHGISMGAAAVMMAAGEKLPGNVIAIIEDCGYSSLWEEFSYQLKGIFGLPPFPVMYLADLACRVKAGFSLREASAARQLKKARVPVLFIHGEEDSFVPFHMLGTLYAACASPKEMFAVPGAGHGEAGRVAGEEYGRRVLGFIARQEALAN